VVALGKATLVDSPERKLKSAASLHEKKFFPAAGNMRAKPNEKELKATSVLAMPLTEVSAKMRVGPPEDDAPDYLLPVWAGVIPLSLAPGTPIRDEKCDPAIPRPPTQPSTSGEP